VTAPPPREVAIPRLLHVASGCLGEMAPLLRGHDFDLGRVLVGSGPGPTRVLAAAAAAGMRAHGAHVVERADLCGRLDQAAAAAGTIIEEGITLAVAVGGGRAIDPLKLAAARTGVDFVSVPTTISNDGISSPVASLVARDGTRGSHPARMPCGIIVDLAAIGSAPPATLRAGVGDLVSNLTACLDWRLADRYGRDEYDAYSALIAESAARPALDLAEVASPASQQLVAQGLLLSGLAMAAAGTSRPCSGAEHLISHALDAHLGDRAGVHGEQVALGSLVSAAAHGSPLLETLRSLFERVGLPTRAEDLGRTRADVVAAVRAAPARRPDRWTILSARAAGDGAAAALVDRALPPRVPTPTADQLAPSRAPRDTARRFETSHSTTRSVA
jgi:glycerol-1-phosphate dehydrogenase [NAD(P)+]